MLAASMFGQKRFASAQIRQEPRPTIHLYAVDPTQGEVTALDRAAEKAGYGLISLPDAARPYAMFRSPSRGQCGTHHPPHTPNILNAFAQMNSSGRERG
jgi:hypothetical protein